VSVIDAPPALRRVTPTGLLVAPSGIPKTEWLALRRTGIGGSDVGALLGMSKYASPYDLYLDKRGERPEMPRSEALEKAAKWGHLHEPSLAAEFSRIHGLRTRRVGLIRHETDAWRLANLDRQISGCPDGPCFLEIKTRSAYKSSEWGASGSEDGVPDTEALQTHHYLAVTGYRHCHVAVLINGNDDRYYRIDHDPEMASDVRAMEADFWKRVIDGAPPPIDGSEATAELLAAMWAGQAGQRVVDSVGARDLIDRREELASEIKALGIERDEASNRLKAMLGDHDIAIAEDRTPLFTWKRSGQLTEKALGAAHPELLAEYIRLAPKFDLAAFKADHPDIYQAVRGRVLRISGGTR
jgi:putative phage-type endonuclease